MNNPRDKELSSLIERHRPAICQICWVYFPHDRYLRTDLYNEIVYRVWRGMPRFRNECSTRTWIYRIAINTAINCYHSSVRSRRYVPLSDTLYDNLPDEEEDQMLCELYELIDWLNPLEKAVIDMYLDRMPQAEIATTLGLSATNVSTIICRIKHKLKKLKEHGAPDT